MRHPSRPLLTAGRFLSLLLSFLPLLLALVSLRLGGRPLLLLLLLLLLLRPDAERHLQAPHAVTNRHVPGCSCHCRSTAHTGGRARQTVRKGHQVPVGAQGKPPASSLYYV